MCQAPLTANGRQFICHAGHSFDMAREGYVNLVLAHQRSSAEAGDPPESVRFRRQFLEAGHYDPLAEAVAEMAEACAWQQVLDAGCGEGWLLRRLQDHIADADRGFHGVDISRTAARMAARSSPQISYAVGNTFRLPVLPAAVDLAIVTMAPRDNGEVRRVLSAAGHFLCVTPGADHLAAFRSHVYEQAQPHADQDIPEGFTEVANVPVRFGLTLTSPESVAQLVEMTPYKWHMDPQTYERVRALPSLVDTAHFTLQLMKRASTEPR